MRREILSATIGSILLVGAGCSGGRPSSFTSAGVPGMGGAAGDRNSAGADPTSGNAMPRAVEEADIIKSDGAGHLYVVNAYRGLAIIDVSNADAPRLVGRAPILGHPVDMYLANGLAYVIVSDYFWWWWGDDDQLDDFHGSQILAIDVGNPAAPHVLSTFRLEGFVSDTRRVGDVIYAVSNQYSWVTDPAGGRTAEASTFVVSIDVANPADPHVVDRLDFAGNANQIHATSDSLFVAQPRWESGVTSWGTTHVQYVDISDPAGHMTMGGAIDVPGYLDNKFQMDAQGAVFRILTHDGGWGPTGSQRLYTFGVANGQLGQLGFLDLAGEAAGGLFGVRFDGDRAYFATFISHDPLEIVDLSDPAQPRLTASLVVPGTLEQIVPRGDRLIALGTESGTWQGVAVSLFDVTDATRPQLLSQADVTGESYGWTQAFWDDKAFAVIDDLNLATVPFQAWDPNTQQSVAGLRLVDVGRQAVAARGLIDQAGAIQRALAIGGRLATLSELSFQTSDISNRDAPRPLGSIELVRNVVDLARVPAGAAQLLAPRDWWRESETMRIRTVTMDHVDDGSYVAELTLPEQSGRMYQNGSLLYVVGQQWDRTSGQSQQRVRVIDVSDLSQPRLRGTAELPANQGGWWWYWGWGGNDSGIVLLEGHLLAMLGGRSYQDSSGQWQYTQTLSMVDIRNPDAPAFAGQTDLGAQWAWGLIADGHIVYMTHAEYLDGQPPLVRDYMDRIDVSNPAQPVRLPSVNIPGLLTAVRDGGARIYTVDYQWSGQNPVNFFDSLEVIGDFAYLDQSFAVDGELSQVRLAGDYAYFTTQRWYWDNPQQQDTVTTRLRTIDVGNPAAMRETSARTLSGAYTLRGIDAGHLFLETGGWWWWGGVYPAGAADGVSGGTPAGGDVACVNVDGFCGFGGSDSLAVFDLRDPAQPAFSSAARLNGWAMSIVVDGQTAYIPSGFYGVQSLTF